MANKIIGTVEAVTFIQDTGGPNGILKVYHYKLKEYKGLLQARHKTKPIAVGTEVIFKLSYKDKDRKLAVGSITKKSEARTDYSTEENSPDKFKIAALNAAVRTESVSTIEQALVAAEFYLAWLKH